MDRRREKGEASVIGPTEASMKTTRAIKPEELSMANSTQVAASRAIRVPFHGADLYVVEHGGQPYTPMKPIVDGIGLDWKSQHRKVATNEGRWGMAIITMPMQGGVSVSETPGDLNGQVDHAGQRRAVTCIPVRKVAAWLATVEPGKVKSPDVRARVIQYQNECDDVLWQYWNEGIAINPRAFSVQPGQTLSAEQAETLRSLLTDRVKRLPRDQQARAMVQGWSKLKAHFKTGYRQIPAGEFHEAVNILARHVADWEVVEDAPASKKYEFPLMLAEPHDREAPFPHSTLSAKRLLDPKNRALEMELLEALAKDGHDVEGARVRILAMRSALEELIEVRQVLQDFRRVFARMDSTANGWADQTRGLSVMFRKKLDPNDPLDRSCYPEQLGVPSPSGIQYLGTAH